MEKITLAGGCFWCTEAIFKRIEGVKDVVSGYIGGAIKNPCYREVCTGRTGHAECVQIDFDPSVISFQSILEIFFATHDPTTLNRQGGDRGTQYRSGVFYHTEEQRQLTLSYIDQLNASSEFNGPIVTEVTKATVFYTSEVEHHEYYDLNKDQPYCNAVISPKIKKLMRNFSSRLKNGLK